MEKALDKNAETEGLGQSSTLTAKQAALKTLIQAMSDRVDLDVQPVFNESLNQAVRACGAGMACLHLVDESQGRLRLVQGHDMDPVRSRALKSLTLNGSTPAARSFSRDAYLEHSAKEKGELPGAACAPVRGGGVPIGCITLFWPGEPAPPKDPYRQSFLASVGMLLGLAVEHAGLISEMVDNLNQVMELKAQEEDRGRELARLNRDLKAANSRLEELSITDSLTGLYNRRHIFEQLEKEINRASRLGHNVTLLLCDLDHFKKINDNLGHQSGDDALRLFSSWLTQGRRNVDLAGRYGGEEFLLILMDCDEAHGVKLADELRRKVTKESMAPPFGDLGGFTVSIGVAGLKKGMDAMAMVAAADKALYKAKRGGRNKVVAASDRR